MSKILAVIGAGNMAGAIVSGILSSSLEISEINIYDIDSKKCEDFAAKSEKIKIKNSIEYAVGASDFILLSVKPQNFPVALGEIRNVPGYKDKIYMSIAAGITVSGIDRLLPGARAVRVMPNLPMTIGLGVSTICRTEAVDSSDFEFVCDIFRTAGRVVIIDEDQMNRYIGVTSSAPAYVYKFIAAVCAGAEKQGLAADRELTDAVCDMVIGAATLLKKTGEAPETLIAKVASKGGTTEKALEALDAGGFDSIIGEAMAACTRRADELGALS